MIYIRCWLYQRPLDEDGNFARDEEEGTRDVDLTDEWR